MPRMTSGLNSILRLLAGAIVVVRVAGYLLYPYEVDRRYVVYSALMVIAFLAGAIFGKKQYRSPLGYVAQGLFVLAIGLTLTYTLEDLRYGIDTVRQVVVIRSAEVLVLLALLITALGNRRQPKSADGSG